MSFPFSLIAWLYSGCNNIIINEKRGVVMKARLIISIDLELAWGYWDCLTAENLRMAETAERPICAALIELFDRYEIPATWAIVAALLDEASAKSRPGGASCWYAPDIIDRLFHAKVVHEIGGHGGRHVE